VQGSPHHQAAVLSTCWLETPVNSRHSESRWQGFRAHEPTQTGTVGKIPNSQALQLPIQRSGGPQFRNGPRAGYESDGLTGCHGCTAMPIQPIISRRRRPVPSSGRQLILINTPSAGAVKDFPETSILGISTTPFLSRGLRTAAPPSVEPTTTQMTTRRQQYHTGSGRGTRQERGLRNNGTKSSGKRCYRWSQGCAGDEVLTSSPASTSPTCALTSIDASTFSPTATFRSFFPQPPTKHGTDRSRSTDQDQGHGGNRLDATTRDLLHLDTMGRCQPTGDRRMRRIKNHDGPRLR
jgi:hypothetical protein